MSRAPPTGAAQDQPVTVAVIGASLTISTSWSESVANTRLAAVGEYPQAAPAPQLHPAVAQLDPRRDDDLVAGGPHGLDRLPRQDRAARPAPALRLRHAGLDGDDLAVGERAESLHDVAVVFETAADEVGEKRARVAAWCECRLHGAVSFDR